MSMENRFLLFLHQEFAPASSMLNVIHKTENLFIAMIDIKDFGSKKRRNNVKKGHFGLYCRSIFKAGLIQCEIKAQLNILLVGCTRKAKRYQNSNAGISRKIKHRDCLVRGAVGDTVFACFAIDRILSCFFVHYIFLCRGENAPAISLSRPPRRSLNLTFGRTLFGSSMNKKL